MKNDIHLGYEAVNSSLHCIIAHCYFIVFSCIRREPVPKLEKEHSKRYMFITDFLMAHLPPIGPGPPHYRVCTITLR
jgi:hypothetical protein